MVLPVGVTQLADGLHMRQYIIHHSYVKKCKPLIAARCGSSGSYPAARQ